MRSDDWRFFWVQGLELRRVNKSRNRAVGLPWYRKVCSEAAWEERRDSVRFTQGMLGQEPTGPFG